MFCCRLNLSPASNSLKLNPWLKATCLTSSSLTPRRCAGESKSFQFARSRDVRPAQPLTPDRWRQSTVLLQIATSSTLIMVRVGSPRVHCVLIVYMCIWARAKAEGISMQQNLRTTATTHHVKLGMHRTAARFCNNPLPARSPGPQSVELTRDILCYIPVPYLLHSSSLCFSCIRDSLR